jgi:hypothetical protein
VAASAHARDLFVYAVSDAYAEARSRTGMARG